MLRAFPGYTLSTLESESSNLLRIIDIVAAGTPPRETTDTAGAIGTVDLTEHSEGW